MAEESLEERIDSEDSSLWDFFISAYSCSRGVRVLLSTLAAGYSYVASIATSIGFYLAVKTFGITTKYISKFIRNPFKEHNPIDYIKKNIRRYIPWKKEQRNPSILGTISSIMAYTLGI